MRITTRTHNESFGDFVRARRATLGLSQVALAGRLGISPSYVSQMERGIVPGRGRLHEIADALSDDPALWLAAAGYTETAAVAESAAPYGKESSGDADVSEYVIRVDRRTGRVTIHQTEGEAPKPTQGGRSDRQKRPPRRERLRDHIASITYRDGGFHVCKR